MLGGWEGDATGMGRLTRRGVLAGGAAALLAACARTRRGDRLTWWGMGATGENAPVLLPPFEEQTGIGVDVQSIPWTGAHEKLLTGFAGDSLPDVALINTAWLPELSLIGALAPAPSDPAYYADQFAGALASVTVGGRPVAVPWTADSWVQYYRRDLLRDAGYPAPPADWDEWRRMAAAMKRRHPDRYVTLHLLDWPEPLFTFSAQQPEPLLRDRLGRGNFSSPGFRAALAFYKEIYDRGWSPAITGGEAGDTFISLSRAYFAILPSDAGTMGDLRRRSAVFPADSWACVRTPGPHGPAAAMARGTSLAVTRNARDPERAWRLVRFLTGAELQRTLWSVTGDLPTRPSAWTMHGLADDPVSAVFGEQIGHSIPPPPVPEWERIMTDAQVVAEHMVRGEFTVDAAAREMDRRTDRILEKRRWLLDKGRIA